MCNFPPPHSIVFTVRGLNLDCTRQYQPWLVVCLTHLLISRCGRQYWILRICLRHRTPFAMSLRCSWSLGGEYFEQMSDCQFLEECVSEQIWVSVESDKQLGCGGGGVHNHAPASIYLLLVRMSLMTRLDANEKDVGRIRDVRTDLLQHARICLYPGRDEVTLRYQRCPPCLRSNSSGREWRQRCSSRNSTGWRSHIGKAPCQLCFICEHCSVGVLGCICILKRLELKWRSDESTRAGAYHVTRRRCQGSFNRGSTILIAAQCAVA